MTLSHYVDQLLAMGYRNVRFVPTTDDILIAMGATHDVFVTLPNRYRRCAWLSSCFYFTSIDITTCTEYDLPF